MIVRDAGFGTDKCILQTIDGTCRRLFAFRVVDASFDLANGVQVLVDFLSVMIADSTLESFGIFKNQIDYRLRAKT